ncbi:hypothetical protein [Paucibacter sp. DJ2R-2]|uniref:hypothetical protein n=1 Tax=Paucibacter sp. DJ2R-2 TaxID=2893558 RepID=UPI0021E4D2B5|nr:hypothetical protein [Paucibacter sp. DJ2R-2]MCV2419962.1 hypothetical protein [Paucibacter sp. DJ4R-1]MCV2437111.1 hypothetical protein [Paucibacter sp. DJ2R-2]
MSRSNFGAVVRAAALRLGCVALLGAGLGLSTGTSQAAEHNLAPGFSSLPTAARVVVMPVDVELFSLSAGGVAEPKADWTSAAHGHMKAALLATSNRLGFKHTELEDTAADEYAEPIALHAAVARSIALHHGANAGPWALPTKAGRLDWSFGDAMQGLKQKTGADYGLFVWVRDSYASAERKVAMVAMALLGVGLNAGQQVGYASLVDLHDGRVVWFNRLARASGDLREADAAAESIAVLLDSFPRTR